MAMATNGNSGGAEREIKSVEITPELVRQVTDKVYKLMAADLRISAERRRIITRPRRSLGGS
jgi:hypothetical protein